MTSITIPESNIQSATSKTIDFGHEWIVETTTGEKVTYRHTMTRNTIRATIQVTVNGALWVQVQARGLNRPSDLHDEYDRMVALLASYEVSESIEKHDEAKAAAAKIAERIFA